MMKEFVKRITTGIAVGGLVTFIMLTIFMVQDIELSIDEIWLHMLGSLMVGSYFGGASLIFEMDSWSPLKQTIIHFTISISVFFSIAFLFDWVLPEPVPVILSIVTFLVIYALFWISFYLYYRKLAQSMNNSI